MKQTISVVWVCSILACISGCSTTPELDQSFGKNIKDSLQKQVVDPKNPDQADSPVGYPFTTNLMK